MVVVFYILAFCLGSTLGSFVNVWVWRTHEGLPITNARSICPSCRAAIAWYDNIQLVSFFLLHARCRSCHQRISVRYPLVELALGLAFMYAAIWRHLGLFGMSPGLIRDWVIVVFLAAIFLYDLQYGEILDRFTLVPAITLLVVNLWYQWISFDNMILSIAIGSGFFSLQYLLSRGRWIGGGDIRLGAFMGAILGWPLILVALFISYVIASIVNLTLIFGQKKTWSNQVPFGPYLTVGTFIAMFSGNWILTWYLNLFRLNLSV